jgi:hypothetical protein
MEELATKRNELLEELKKIDRQVRPPCRRADLAPLPGAPAGLRTPSHAACCRSSTWRPSTWTPPTPRATPS